MKNITYYYINNNYNSKDSKPNENISFKKKVLKRNTTTQITNYFNMEQNKNSFISKEDNEPKHN